MSCEIDIDYGNKPDAFKERHRTARKQHMCCECNRLIEKGEKYLYESGIWKDEPKSFKTCVDCESVRNTFFCTHIYEMVWEDMEQLVYDCDGQLSSEKMERLTPAARDRLCGLIDDYIKERAETDSEEFHHD